MSLQVWLPLTKDLRNQGLASITSSGTPVFKNSGKLGSKSLDLNTRINFSCSALNNVSTFSVAFWAKTNQDSNISGDWMDVLGLTDISTSGSGGQLRWETCYTIGAPTRGISSHDNGTYATVQGPSGQPTVKGNWNHFCITVDPSGSGRAIEYWDGVKIGDYVANGGHLNGNFWTGETNKVNGEIQDIRIYDHCLSPMEVKELAKGLVLHYPLDDVYGEATTNLFYNKTIGFSDGDRWQIVSTYPSGHIPAGLVYKQKSSNSYYGSASTFLSNTKSPTFWNGKYLTFSCWYYRSSSSTSEPHIDVYGNNGSSSYASAIDTFSKNNTSQVGKWAYCTITIKFRSDLSNYSSLTYIKSPEGLSGDLYIADIQLEEKNHATPYAKGTRTASTIEYDCSGFCNNGTRTGTFSWTSDTPKYNVSTKFPNNCNTWIVNIDFPQITKNLTFTCWCKIQQGSNSSWSFIVSQGRDNSQSGFNLVLNGTEYAVHGSFGALKSGVTVDNTWKHLVGTYDGATVKIYINGELKNSMAYTSDLTYTYAPAFVIGKMAYNYTSTSSYFPVNGLVSDVRIYATALSAEDVKSLYNNSAYIDNQGNLYGAVYEEV